MPASCTDDCKYCCETERGPRHPRPPRPPRPPLPLPDIVEVLYLFDNDGRQPLLVISCDGSCLCYCRRRSRQGCFCFLWLVLMQCTQEHPPSDSKDAFIDAIDGCHDFFTTVTGSCTAMPWLLAQRMRKQQTIVAPASSGHCSPCLIHSVIGWKWK